MTSTLEMALAGLDREQLQRILLALAERTPALAGVIAAQATKIAQAQSAPSGGAGSATAPGGATSTPARREPQPPVDPKPYGRRMRDVLRPVGYSSRYASYGGATSVVTGLDELLDEVRPFVEAGDGRNALAILQVVTDEYVSGWTDLDDSSGEMGDAFQRLGTLWAEALLSADLTPAERHAWAERLERWQREISEYGVDDAFTAAQQAAAEGWDDPALQQVLRGEAAPSYPVKTVAPQPPSWEAPSLAEVRLTVLARQGRTEEYLRLAAAEALFTQRAAMLAQLGRTQEAVESGLATLEAAADALSLAQALHAQGATAAALDMAEHGLRFQPPAAAQATPQRDRFARGGADSTAAGNSAPVRAALARWLRDAASAAGEPQRALAAATIAVREAPSLADYLAVPPLAGDGWPAVRDALLAHLRQIGGFHQQAQVDIFLHEGLTADAIAVVDAAQYLTSHDYPLIERVVEAASGSHPEWALRTCRSHAERIMDAAKSQYYQHASRWLDLGRQAAVAAGPEQATVWRTYLDDLMVRHARKRSLVPLVQGVRSEMGR